MPLPPGFVEDVNAIGLAVRQYDDPYGTAAGRRELLKAALRTSCRLLGALHGSQLEKAADALSGNGENILDLVRDPQKRKLFFNVEDTIMRDVGINTISRKIILVTSNGFRISVRFLITMSPISAVRMHRRRFSI
jgi:hypothetical protein